MTGGSGGSGLLGGGLPHAVGGSGNRGRCMLPGSELELAQRTRGVRLCMDTRPSAVRPEGFDDDGLSKRLLERVCELAWYRFGEAAKVSNRAGIRLESVRDEVAAVGVLTSERALRAPALMGLGEQLAVFVRRETSPGSEMRDTEERAGGAMVERSSRAQSGGELTGGVCVGDEGTGEGDKMQLNVGLMQLERSRETNILASKPLWSMGG